MQKLMTVLTLALLVFANQAPAQDSTAASVEVCVPTDSTMLTLRRDGRTVRIDIDDFANPGGPDPALCCSSCDAAGENCTGCVNLPTFTTCHGEILACPEGEILTEDGGGACA